MFWLQFPPQLGWLHAADPRLGFNAGKCSGSSFLPSLVGFMLRILDSGSMLANVLAPVSSPAWLASCCGSSTRVQCWQMFWLQFPPQLGWLHAADPRLGFNA